MSTSAGVLAAAPPRPVRPKRPASLRVPLALPRACAVSGVSAGLARHLGAPVDVVRALFVVLGLLGGAGVLLYAWLWAVTPRESGSDTITRSVPVAWLLLAATGAGLIALIPATRDPYALSWSLAVPPIVRDLPIFLVVVVVSTVTLAVAAGTWAALVDRVDRARGARHALTVRGTAAGALVVTFIGLLDGYPMTRLELLIALLPVAGVVALASTNVIVKLRELSHERITRIREEHRAEMAAHLHDSVLQTLALIQNRSGASSEVARLARAQERELRAWLYDGDQPADSDLPTDLRDFGGALELDYPVRVEVVSAGMSSERASGEIAAAAREAMLNAARHAGGDVSVFIEGRPSGVDVFIRDRGEGFDVDAVRGDRLGVRESIIGRMRRAGGSATVTSSEAGTEVHLQFGSTVGGAGE